jgi:hypothetical protein
MATAKTLLVGSKNKVDITLGRGIFFWFNLGFRNLDVCQSEFSKYYSVERWQEVIRDIRCFPDVCWNRGAL